MAKMNRRDMLRLFTSGAVGAMVLDPEKLLWVPGEKTIFLPSPAVIAAEDAVYSVWVLAVRIDNLAGGALSSLGTKIDTTDDFKTQWEEVVRTDQLVLFEEKVAEAKRDGVPFVAAGRPGCATR